ncbi:aldehyde dehydrogenase [Limnofasciculus baicalensis]|uniref:Aldehyde dehydrogenase n=1 Tax=Limnofasciculus baicalensis BBK-W-15 TaxID=2699891 RepID=A0AAE3KMH4_9CYAN|nr:aldehyde dehydrogenase [Limnofasciculus baicalensis]MCP2729224.1 aldehyde dehydrogenase [Limnofasciculus baicalensis BBK-W-15]
MLTQTPVKDIICQQREFFATGKTKSVEWRIEQLKRLKQGILDDKEAIINAVKADLGRPDFEAYFEIAAISEINYALKHIKSWSKPKKVSTSIDQFPSSAQIYPEPLGVILIISPWNYPFSLLISPLVGAIAAGNCAILKPSEIAAHTSGAIAKMIEKTFDSPYIAVVEGGVEASQALLAEKFDHIFFTGGTAVGKIIMAAAAKHLTPVTLELGGKSPCIIDADVDLKYAAKRITWGKYLNAGQTCIAPDYLLADSRIKSDLLTEIKKCVNDFYGGDPFQSPDYARIISRRHLERLQPLLKDGKIVVGGECNPEEKYIAPTVIDGVDWDSPVMAEEIFGPILPVLEYTDLNVAIAEINARPKPLALYFFSKDKQKQELVLQQTSSGGVSINDTIMQVGVTDLPFGGVGDSGIGSYHGKASFDTFSHYKSVLKKGLWFDQSWRYPPYKDKLSLIKRIVG